MKICFICFIYRRYILSLSLLLCYHSIHGGNCSKYRFSGQRRGEGALSGLSIARECLCLRFCTSGILGINKEDFFCEDLQNNYVPWIVDAKTVNELVKFSLNLTFFFRKNRGKFIKSTFIWSRLAGLSQEQCREELLGGYLFIYLYQINPNNMNERTICLKI